jgi:NAD(P)-dependent dehydrogenase (short-subunit alcohol dehydrogenase family)
MTSLVGKSAVVTGGTRGIGLAIARALLDCGCRVFLCARDKGDVAETVGSLGNIYPDLVRGRACDVQKQAEVQSLFAAVSDACDGLDILINNAGVGSHSYVEQMPVEEWEATIATNLSGVFYCSRAAIPLMKAREGGYIINIGSLAGKNAFAGGAAYCASKFGLIGFTESLMQEVRYSHIRVTCVMPGSVNTSFGRHAAQDPADTWKLWPEDVAQVVVSLLRMDPRALPSRVELRPSEPRK